MKLAQVKMIIVVFATGKPSSFNFSFSVIANRPFSHSIKESGSSNVCIPCWLAAMVDSLPRERKPVERKM